MAEWLEQAGLVSFIQPGYPIQAATWRCYSTGSALQHGTLQLIVAYAGLSYDELWDQ